MVGNIKTQKFLSYCATGNIKKVQELIDNPSVDINWNYNVPLRNAIMHGHIEIVKLLLASPRLNTELVGNYDIIINTLKLKYYEVLDLFRKSGKFVFERTEYLDVLLRLDDPELNDYMTADQKFLNFIMSFGANSEYNSLIPTSARSIFLF